MERLTSGCKWRHALEAPAEDFGDFEKVCWVEFYLGGRRWTFARSLRPCGRCHTCSGGGADGKVIIERLCISLPYVETFNSKVIKGFVHELRSRNVFFVFRDSYVLCICVMNILCTFHIFRYGYVTQIENQYTAFNFLCGILTFQRNEHEKVCIAFTDSTVFKNVSTANVRCATVKAMIIIDHISKEKRSRDELDAATLATCIRLHSPDWWQFKMWEVFLWNPVMSKYCYVKNFRVLSRNASKFKWMKLMKFIDFSRAAMDIVAGNEHGDKSSNLGRDWLHFT